MFFFVDATRGRKHFFNFTNKNPPFVLYFVGRSKVIALNRNYSGFFIQETHKFSSQTDSLRFEVRLFVKGVERVRLFLNIIGFFVMQLFVGVEVFFFFKGNVRFENVYCAKFEVRQAVKARNLLIFRVNGRMKHVVTCTDTLIVD